MEKALPILCILLALTLLLGCAGNGNSSNAPSQPSPVSPPPNQTSTANATTPKAPITVMQVYESSGGAYSTVVPNGWYIYSSNDTAGFSDVVYKTSETGAQIRIVSIVSKQNITPDDYFSGVLKSANKTLQNDPTISNFTLVNESASVGIISGERTYQDISSFVYLFNGVASKSFNRWIFIKHGNEYVTLTFSFAYTGDPSGEKLKAAYESDFESVIENFKFV